MGNVENSLSLKKRREEDVNKLDASSWSDSVDDWLCGIKFCYFDDPISTTKKAAERRQSITFKTPIQEAPIVSSTKPSAIDLTPIRRQSVEFSIKSAPQLLSLSFPKVKSVKKESNTMPISRCEAIFKTEKGCKKLK